MDPVDNAQSPALESDTQNTPGQGQEGQTEGQVRLNQRFAEMTKTINETREMLASQQALNQQLIATQAQLHQQLTTRGQPQTPAVPQFTLPEGTDPQVAAVFNNMASMFQKQLEESAKRTEETINRAVGGVRMSQEQMELNQAMSSQPKEVQELAGRLLQSWRQQGYTGWKPQDAITFARGQLGVANTPPPRRTHNDDMVPGGSPPPDPRGQTLPPPLPDEQLKRMTLKQQEEYWFKRAGDTPLVF